MLNIPSGRRTGLPRRTGLFPLILLLLSSSMAEASVGPLPATDREMTQVIRRALSRDPELARAPLSVSATAGHVVLRGQVKTLAGRRKAVRLTAQQRGVLAIEDQLELSSAGLDDRTILLRLSRLLVPYRDLTPPGLRLEVRGGVVHAEGYLGTMGRLLFLERLLQRVEGVQDLDLGRLRVEVMETEPRDDHRLRSAVLGLIRNPLIFPISGRIDVEAVQGTVILSGAVPRLIDRMEAIKVASLVPGVVAVKDTIEVVPTLGRTRQIKPGSKD
ncbi:MAG: BON domain-containing protein [Acidobacteriota bacterium]